MQSHKGEPIEKEYPHRILGCDHSIYYEYIQWHGPNYLNTMLSQVSLLLFKTYKYITYKSYPFYILFYIQVTYHSIFYEDIFCFHSGDNDNKSLLSFFTHGIDNAFAVQCVSCKVYECLHLGPLGSVIILFQILFSSHTSQELIQSCMNEELIPPILISELH